jgi:hypothetical protein
MNFLMRLLVPLAFALAGTLAVAQVPESARGTITTQNLVPTGTATASSCVALRFTGMGGATAQVSGTYTGALSLQRSSDGAVWETLSATSTFTNAAGTATATISSGVTGTFTLGNVAGYRGIRVCGLAAMTGTATVAMQATAAGGSSGGSSGGGDASAANQSTMITSLSVIDDWDESDRAKVNVIVGQAGVAAGAGAVGATVIRTTQASDSPMVTNQGAAADAACATDNGTCSEIALKKRIAQNLTTLNTSVNTATGAQVIASSSAVNIASDQMGTVATAGAATSRLPISEPDGPIITGTLVGANGNLSNMPIDMTGYECAAVQVTSAAGTITYTQSIDNTTFFGVNGFISTNGGSSGSIGTTTTTGLWRFPRIGKYMNLAVTSQTGTNTAQVMLTKTPCPSVIATNTGQTLVVSGAVAHDAAISGSPVRIGGRAVTTNYTAVATGDTADLVATTVGSLVTYPWSIPDATWQYASAADVTDTTSTEMKAAVASQRNYVKSCIFSNTDATVGTYVNVLSAASVIGVVYVAPQIASTAGQNSLPVQFGTPLRGAVNEAINFQAVTTSAQLRVACQGFTSAH